MEQLGLIINAREAGGCGATHVPWYLLAVTVTVTAFWFIAPSVCLSWQSTCRPHHPVDRYNTLCPIVRQSFSRRICIDDRGYTASVSS